MTPVTRLELYLSILAGGAGTAPSPITREEMYLAKACDLSVTVPDPITCREEYLYKISGGTITLQSPITRLEQFMAAAAGMAVTPPTPITREEWFWYQLSNGTTTITGVPPITFTSDGTALSAYSVTGNLSQTGTPTPAQPIVPEECGDLVTTGEHAGEYAIPITCGGTTYPLYLSEPLRKIGDYADSVDSSGVVTRRIRKLVLTGTEDCYLESTAYGKRIYLIVSGAMNADTEHPTALSSHFELGAQGSTYILPDVFTIAGQHLYISRTQDYTTLEDFTDWLSAQYAANTPVCVWYVLTTPTTETVTCPTITPASGSNTLSIGTTLAPSEVSITGHIS